MFQNKTISPKLGACLEVNHNERSYGEVFLVITSLSSAFLIFIFVLVVQEAKLWKHRQMLEAQKKRECGTSSRRRSSNFNQGNLDELNDKYDKIDASYLTVLDEDNVDESADSDQADTINFRRQQDTINSAEMILRELFVVPSKEELQDTPPLVMEKSRGSRRERFRDRVRRYTMMDIPSEPSQGVSRKISFSSNQAPLPSQLPAVNYTRRRAVVFSNDLSFSDDNYSTVV